MSSAQNCLKLKNITFCKWLNNYEGVVKKCLLICIIYIIIVISF